MARVPRHTDEGIVVASLRVAGVGALGHSQWHEVHAFHRGAVAMRFSPCHRGTADRPYPHLIHPFTQ